MHFCCINYSTFKILYVLKCCKSMNMREIVMKVGLSNVETKPMGRLQSIVCFLFQLSFQLVLICLVVRVSSLTVLYFEPHGENLDLNLLLASSQNQDLYLARCYKS